MMTIYFDDGVNQSICVQKCNTIEEAQDWIRDQLKDYTMVDAEHPCSEIVMDTSATAQYQVYDGGPVTISEDGVPNLAAPVYESGYFYTEGISKPDHNTANGQAMKKRKYYYIVECSNGINSLSTFKYAKNHWEAEELAATEYFEKFLAYPVDVESRKSTKTECDNIFNF